MYGVSLTTMLVFLSVVPSVVVLLSLALVSAVWLALAFRWGRPWLSSLALLSSVLLSLVFR